MDFNDGSEPMSLLYEINDLNNVESIVLDHQNRCAIKYKMNNKYDGPLKLYILYNTYDVEYHVFNINNKVEFEKFNSIFIDKYPI